MSILKAKNAFSHLVNELKKHPSHHSKKEKREKREKEPVFDTDPVTYCCVSTPRGQENWRVTNYFVDSQVQRLAEKARGIPVFLEHNTRNPTGTPSVPCGIVLYSHYHPSNNKLYSFFILNNLPTGKWAKYFIGEDGKLPPDKQIRQVSLGFVIDYDANGLVKQHAVKELTLCYKGAMEGCHIIHAAPLSYYRQGAKDDKETSQNMQSYINKSAAEEINKNKNNSTQSEKHKIIKEEEEKEQKKEKSKMPTKLPDIPEDATGEDLSFLKQERLMPLSERLDQAISSQFQPPPIQNSYQQPPMTVSAGASDNLDQMDTIKREGDELSQTLYSEFENRKRAREDPSNQPIAPSNIQRQPFQFKPELFQNMTPPFKAFEEPPEGTPKDIRDRLYQGYLSEKALHDELIKHKLKEREEYLKRYGQVANEWVPVIQDDCERSGEAFDADHVSAVIATMPEIDQKGAEGLIRFTQGLASIAAKARNINKLEEEYAKKYEEVIKRQEVQNKKHEEQLAQMKEQLNQKKPLFSDEKRTPTIPSQAPSSYSQSASGPMVYNNNQYQQQQLQGYQAPQTIFESADPIYRAAAKASAYINANASYADNKIADINAFAAHKAALFKQHAHANIESLSGKDLYGDLARKIAKVNPGSALFKTEEHTGERWRTI